MPTTDIPDVLTYLKEFGGWGIVAFIVVYASRAAMAGGRTFLALAKQFSADVVAELKEIKTAIQGQERRVDTLSEKVEHVDQQVGEQSVRIERLNELVVGHAVACKEKP
jgi:hypothetical protein